MTQAAFQLDADRTPHGRGRPGHARIEVKLIAPVVKLLAVIERVQ